MAWIHEERYSLLTIHKFDFGYCVIDNEGIRVTDQIWEKKSQCKEELDTIKEYYWGSIVH